MGLIEMIHSFRKNDIDMGVYDTLYPIGLYKLLVFYEEFEVVELLYKQEAEFNHQNEVMTEVFIYALLINNPLLALAISKKYATTLYKSHPAIITAVLNYLNEFTETNGNSQYM